MEHVGRCGSFTRVARKPSIPQGVFTTNYDRPRGDGAPRFGLRRRIFSVPDSYSHCRAVEHCWKSDVFHVCVSCGTGPVNKTPIRMPKAKRKMSVPVKALKTAKPTNKIRTKTHRADTDCSIVRSTSGTDAASPTRFARVPYTHLHSPTNTAVHSAFISREPPPGVPRSQASVPIVRRSTYAMSEECCRLTIQKL
jgi:hypothetical protein